MTCRYRFISTHRAARGAQRSRRVLGVARSEFYRWLADEPARRERAVTESELVETIREIHVDPGATCRSPRVAAELRPKGRLVNRTRVERLL